MSADRHCGIFDILRTAELRLEGNVESVEPQASLGTTPVEASATKSELSVRKAVIQPSNVKQMDSAGANWFNIPKTVPTQELKRDWQLLRMRGILDPKHRKKALNPELPKYSQVGEIIAGPTDFFSGRLTRKDRRETMFGEVMKDYQHEKFSAKYAGIQKTKMSGKRAFYNQLVSQRRKKRG